MVDAYQDLLYPSEVFGTLRYYSRLLSSTIRILGTLSLPTYGHQRWLDVCPW